MLLNFLAFYSIHHEFQITETKRAIKHGISFEMKRLKFRVLVHICNSDSSFSLVCSRFYGLLVFSSFCFCSFEPEFDARILPKMKTFASYFFV